MLHLSSRFNFQMKSKGKVVQCQMLKWIFPNSFLGYSTSHHCVEKTFSLAGRRYKKFPFQDGKVTL